MKNRPPVAMLVWSILSSPNRLFFCITLAVFLIILYLLNHLGDGPSIKTRVLPNYEKQFDHKQYDSVPVLSNLPMKFYDTEVQREEQVEQNFGDSNKLTDDNDAAIFYIDPPDFPITTHRPRRPLIAKNIRGRYPANDLDQDTDLDEYQEYHRERGDVLKNQQQEQNMHEREDVHHKEEPQDEKREYRKKEEQKLLSEQWEKLREEQHRLLEDKIRWQKELGQWKLSDQQNLLYRSRLPPTDPQQWLELNSSMVELHYPGVLFSREYKLHQFIDNRDKMAAGMENMPHELNDMTDGQAEDRFYQLLTTTHMDCGDIKRLGNTEDGGWDLCVVEPFLPQPGCIVYSFGINYDFTFDDALAETFGCEIRSFDPSMTVGDHMHLPKVYFYQLGLGAANTVNDKGWRLETMGSIRKKLGHLNRTVDIVKMDIEYNEWSCLRTMLKEGVLRTTKQLALEIHTPEVYSVGRPSTKEDFYMMYDVLYGLEKQGFRKYHFTYNPLGKYTSVRTGKPRSCCYELYFVNIKYLRS